MTTPKTIAAHRVAADVVSRISADIGDWPGLDATDVDIGIEGDVTFSVFDHMYDLTVRFTAEVIG
jgi:hypothetical protein